MAILRRVLIGFLPLLLTVLFAWALLEGGLSLGGGEKEIFLVVPPLFWSLVYLFCYLVFWWRGSAIGRSVARSAGIATGVVFAAWLLLLGASFVK